MIADCAMLGTAAFGRALDARGAPLDGFGPVEGVCVRVGAPAALPAQRSAIVEPLWTGVRCIDALMTIGRGARIGIFGAPGAGKSTLLETIVRGARADAVAIGLVGERGREAARWIAARDERTTVICATSDRPAHERARAAELLMAHACALAARGLHVLAVLDSLARYVNALRELAVHRGESVGRGGYPPSVFARTAQLVERAGAFCAGSVTLIATVLNDGDDRDPVSENARSLLDGHLQLSPRLAQAGRFPAIDVLASASRTMDSVACAQHRRAASLVRAALARLERCEDARSLGIEPADPQTKVAIAAEGAIERLLRQGPLPVPVSRALAALHQTADMLEEAYGH
jgi:type III secretion protein N (ATPase)